ncbi:hypothetical protein [Mogibacterium sp.]|uniref:hypothetical protein n=1 Tax=Mogibacterium sp. TaxID=2049035 RepID=UPI00257F68DC|nr:hypothetical protein [Mogibacterium sp.]MBN2935944.1 hypothetical protein [Mogibacterium sp.]
MKNREKYRDEIMEAIKRRRADNDNMCRFLRNNVIPRFASEADVEREVCGNLECYTCANLFAFWLDEEYEEPPKPEVDWDNVPVDTLVRVRNHERKDWQLRYFKGIDDSRSDRFMAWECGATSVTAEGDYTNWKYCELVEDEDD